MTNLYARVVDGVVIEVCDGETLATHVPSLQAQFQECPDDVAANWTFVAPSTWTAPVAPTPPAARYANLTPIQYYNAFTAAEAIAIKTSNDPVVQEIWYRLQTAITASGNVPIIDPNSTPVQAGLTYLSTASPTPYIQPSRIPQICAGVAQ
jgi:hypothetical protein